MSEILHEIFENNPLYGGTQMIKYAAKGAGKTMLDHHMIRASIQRGDLVIVRASSLDTWHTLARTNKLRAITLGDYEFKLRSIKVKKSEKVRLEDIGIEEVRVNSPETAINVMSDGKPIVNIIITDGMAGMDRSLGKGNKETMFWVLLLYYLMRNDDERWTTVYFDEIQEIFNANPSSGEQWAIQQIFRTTIFNHFRKARINFRASTHTYHNLDFDLQSMFAYKMIMYGGIPIHQWDYSQDFDFKTIKKGEAIVIDAGSQWERLKLPYEPEHAPDTVIETLPESVEFHPELDERYCKLLGITKNIICASCGEIVPYTRVKCPSCKEKLISPVVE